MDHVVCGCGKLAYKEYKSWEMKTDIRSFLES